ncbi:MAG: hypothetical protein RL264_3101 [Bacteroidota bacterium]|jgi:gliding motility-associated-like protein
MKNSKLIVVCFLFCTSDLLSQNQWFTNLIPQEYQSQLEYGQVDENWPKPNIELIQYRRDNSKTFIDEDHVYHTITSGGKLHYLAGNQYLTLQQNATQTANQFGIFKSDLPLFTNITNGSSSLSLNNNGDCFILGNSKRFRLLSQNDEEQISIPIVNTGVSSVNGNKLSLSTNYPQFNSTFDYTYWSFRFNMEIASPLTFPSDLKIASFKQSYTLPLGYQLSYFSGEMTEKGWHGSLKITNSQGNIVGTISPAQIFDSYAGNDKNDVADHIIPGFYLLNQDGNSIDIQFDADYLRRPDLVYPVIIDPTVSNTYTGNRALQDKNTQFNANCQQTMLVNVPITGFQVTGSTTTYRIWAKGYIAVSGSTTYYADKVEQRSRVGCNNSWTATQSGSGTYHNGSSFTYTSTNNGQSYTMNNQSMCNGCFPNQNSLTYVWQGYQTYFPVNATAATNVSGCVLNYQELVTNTWQVTTTYVALPTMNAVNNQTVCAGTQTAAIAFSGASTYSWTNNNTAIGLGASGTGNINAFTATNNTGSPITATITVTPTNNPCNGTPITFTITVNPTPTVTNPGNQTVCAGQTTTAVIFSGTAGSTFNWTNNNTNIGLTSANGIGDIPSFTGLNTGSTNNISTISVTPSIGTCNGTAVNFTITVAAPPSDTAPANQTICNGQSTAAITFSGNATSYPWTNDNTTTGLAANGTGNIASFNATNTSSAPITSTITVTPTSGTCTGTPVSFTITVNPSPTVSTPTNQSVCANQQTSTVTFSGTGTSYAWTNNTPSIGLGASGTGDIAAFTATNTTSSPVTATISVTPSANGCTGTAVNFTITVSLIPSVNAITSQTLCNGAQTTSITFSGTGTTYGWSNNTTSIGLGANGTGNIAAFTVTNSTANPITATVSVVPSIGTCVGTAGTFSITVNPSITPTFTTAGPFCQGATPTALPTNSNNSIAGVWAPSTISTSTVGNATYTFTPTPGQCASNVTMTVTTTPLIVPTFTSIPAICQNTTAPSLPSTSNNAINGAWNPSTISTTSIGTSTYTFTPTAGQCASNTTMDITINNAPTPLFTTNLTQGCAPLNVTLAITNPSVNTTYTWTINGNNAGTGASISPTLTSEACYNVSVQANENNCIGNATQNNLICVQLNPIVNFTSSPNEITNNPQTVTFNNSGSNSLNYNWNFGDGQTSTDFSPSHVYSNVNGGITVVLSGSTTFGCIGTASLFIPFKDESVFYVPNTFTPDGDEFNQTWRPVFSKGFDPYNFNVYVFDRWGELIWENHDYRVGWDGTNGGKGRKAPEGIYTWRIEYKPQENDKKVIVVGHINLIR